MWQAFVPATERDEHGLASKKRRRAVAAGDGEAVSAIYESIVRPGKTSSHGSGRSSSSSSRSTSHRSSRGQGDADYRSRAGASPLLPPSPPSPPIGAEILSRGVGGGKIPARASAVFGPTINPNIAREFENGTEREGEGEEEEEEEEKEEEEGFFCQVCGERVKSLSEEKHNTSTLHIFNQNHRPQGRKVQIHESNKGFQLLSGMGWNLDEGLGARKQGRVNPLQTTFKRGTTGLGAGEKLRPRVTHFPSHVPSQAINAPDGKSDAVRAHESLDRRRRRRRNTGSNSGGSGGSGSGSGVVLDVARSSAAAESSHSSWGGFWGQGTHSGSNSSSRGAPAGGTSNSSREGRSGGGVSRGGGRGGGNGREGEGSFMTRKEREAQVEREKRKERRARFELLSDVPEEYAALFMG